MEISIFLAKIIGFFMIIDGLMAITRKEDLIPVFADFKNKKIEMMILGMVLFVAGLLITASHNVWSGSIFQIVITLIGWIITIKGLLLVLVPVGCIASIVEKVNKPIFFTIGGLIAVLIGVLLTLSGFIL